MKEINISFEIFDGEDDFGTKSIDFIYEVLKEESDFMFLIVDDIPYILARICVGYYPDISPTMLLAFYRRDAKSLIIYLNENREMIDRIIRKGKITMYGKETNTYFIMEDKRDEG